MLLASGAKMVYSQRMNKISVPFLNILLAVGVISILAGVASLIRILAGVPLEYSFLNGGAIIAGAVIFYLCLAFFPVTQLLFSGMYLCLSGWLILIISLPVVPLTFAQLWPLEVSLCGLCVFLTGIVKRHKIRNAYLFPSILLFVLGFLFLLFSLKIIKTSFVQFFSVWGPVFLILLGVFIVTVYLYQKNLGNKFPYEQEDKSYVENSIDEMNGDSVE